MSSSTTTTTSVTSLGSDLGAQGDLGAGAPSDLGAPLYGGAGPAGPSGPGGYGGAPTSPGYGAPGQGPSGGVAGLTNGLASALSSSNTFRSIFRAGVSSQIASRIATSAIQATLSSGLGVDAGSAQRISGSLQSVISNLGGGADTNSYAQAIASSVVSGLSSSGVLNSNNASDLGVGLVRGILQNAAQVAGQYGIRISQNDVASDISRVSNTLLSSMSSSATTTTTSVSSIGSSSLDVGRNGVGISGDLGSLLSSPSGISSPRASGRIQALAKGVLNSLRPDGLDVNSFAQSLGAIIADASSSGLSPAEAKLEALMEALVSLVQILSSAQIRQVDFSNTSALSSSFQRAMVNVLG